MGCVGRWKCNAVAPDWNLKQLMVTWHNENKKNAVAPDWNLKHQTWAF